MTIYDIRALERRRRLKKRIAVILSILAFLVVFAVAWWLKLTAITMAGEAFCGMDEHIHTSECYESTLKCTEEHEHTEECYNVKWICGIQAHTHIPSCYSDIKADLETNDDWEATLPDIPEEMHTADRIISIAHSQLGYTESERNFILNETDERKGYTRYGEWYGNRYGDWANMFTSFCLQYAGVSDVTLSAGANTMKLGWEELDRYRLPDEYTPFNGDIIFLDKDLDGTVDTTAIILEITDAGYTVAEGDLENMVSEAKYIFDDPMVKGFGITSPEAAPMITEPAEEQLIVSTDEMQADPVIQGASGTGELAGAPGQNHTVWLDGTCGGLMALAGAGDRAFNVRYGSTLTLPTEWQTPSEYSYVVKGWYDVKNNKYYQPGDVITVTEDLVFYTDWVAYTYDIGQYNARTADTVSTNDFITTRMFDYGILFNVLSSYASNISISGNSHTETWTLITNGASPYSGEQTLDYIFRDWDKGSEDISYPVGVNNPGPHYPTDAGNVYTDLYTAQIADLLFNPSTKVIGKEYLGTADHLFQLCTDPTHDHYGYYYYDSEKNAASYNQSDGRFYVYEYLEQTTVSASNEDNGKYSDFLPLNSPYVNTNGHSAEIYHYDGTEGEYAGVDHYMYDATASDASDVTTNFFFGMTVDIDFYLPTAPGSGQNLDVYGKEMHFKFSGDDDVWIFVDGKMVLDLGGIHGIESGDINFSTGVVTVNGVQNNTLTNTLRSIGAGEHILTMYYLERGSSMSNCAIYFNLAPRFSFSIQKEDVLTKDVLNGAQFSVYTDKECTEPAELWESKASHDRNDPSTNVFTVTNGAANMWGMGSGNTYYIKETKPPDDPDYDTPKGIISVSLDKRGVASYAVEVLKDSDGSPVSGGFTVHGFKIDEETQQAYIVATNAPLWVKETTSVEVRKHWDDKLDHSGDSITVYLTTTDPDGTVRRLREIELSNTNDWHYLWDNLPKYREDGVTEVIYGIEEGYASGYYSKVEQTDGYDLTKTVWTSVNTLENGQTYIIGSSSGYLSTVDNAADTGFKWVDEETAKASPNALWTVTKGGNYSRLTNALGQSITFYYNGGSSGYPTDFFASTAGESNEAKQYMALVTHTNGIRLYYDGGDGRDYYLVSSMTDSMKFNYSTNANDALLLLPKVKQEVVLPGGDADSSYLLTNTPLDKSNETSLKVIKSWDVGMAPDDTYLQAQVTFKLYANGVDTGRSLTVNLKNNWQGTFLGLPYKDADGNVISYTVHESWDTDDWLAKYGEIKTVQGNIPSYETTVTNVYRWGRGYQLPETKSVSDTPWILSGGTLMLSSVLIYGYLSGRKRRKEGRTK